jgi:hypothetical protein
VPAPAEALMAVAPTARAPIAVAATAVTLMAVAPTAPHKSPEPGNKKGSPEGALCLR